MTVFALNSDIDVDAQSPSEVPVKAGGDEGVSEDVNWRSVTRNMKIGDSDAFAIFYEHCYPVMLTQVRRCIGRDEATCLDIVQDAMLKSIRCIKAFDSKLTVMKWASMVAKSVAYDWLRKRVRQLKVENENSQSDRGAIVEAAVDAEDDGTFELDYARMVWVEQELQALPSSMRDMIELRYRLGWSLQQIGTRFGLKPGAVDGRIRRSVEGLKKRAREEFGENEYSEVFDESGK